jgi:hypothetical protein
VDLPLHRRLLVPDLPRQLLVLVRQLGQLDQVAGPALQAVPGRGLLTVFGGLSRQLPGSDRIVPGPWLGQLAL